MNKKSSKNVNWIKWASYGAIFIGIILAYQLLPIDVWTNNFKIWVEGLGPIGWFITILAYALATTALVPGSILTIAAGIAFGLWAFPIVIVGATIGAGIAFLCGRYFAHNKVQKIINERPKFKAIDNSIKDEGWKVVGLMRLSPAIPFNLQNWLFGATSVGFWPYILATFFGIMPGSLLYVWIGSLGGSAALGGDTSTAKYVLFGIGILATLAVTWIVSKKATKKLNKYT